MNKKTEIAILMAAGKGTRMFPLTLTTPKPLVPVHGVPMIETVIQGLQARGVAHIYVVVGYLKEQFAYLEKKYPRLTLVENREYLSKNNISSIRAVSEIMLGGCDCFVCEADLYVPDPELFSAELDQSCYFGKLVPGHSDDWVFDLQDGRITRVGKGGDDAYNMCGVAYLRSADAALVARAVAEASGNPENDQLFWDEIVDRNLDQLALTVHPVAAEQIVEIDSVKELKAVDAAYENCVSLN